MSEILSRAETRQQIAEHILQELDLVNRWSQFGQCNLVGAGTYRLVVAPDIDIENWRLSVDGKAVSKPLSLKYADLLKMKMTTQKALLICPNFFADYAEWEGVPLKEILKEAKVSSDYNKVDVKAIDGYKKSFTREEIDSNLFFFALKVNGEVLPKDH